MREAAVTTLRGRWAQGLEPRFFCWIVRDRLAASERPGRVRPQPPEDPAPGGADLARPERLHAGDLAARLAAQPAGLRGGRASRTSTSRSVSHDELADRLPLIYEAIARRLDVPTEKVLLHNEEFGDRLLGRDRGLPHLRGAGRRGPARDRGERAARRARARRDRPRDRRDHRRGAHRARARAPHVRTPEPMGTIIVIGPPRARRPRCPARGAEPTAAVRGRRRARGRPRDGRARATTSTTPSTTRRCSEAVSRVVKNERYQLLERLATRIGEVCRTDDRVSAVTVTVRKLHPPVRAMLDHVAVARRPVRDPGVPRARLQPRRPARPPASTRSTRSRATPRRSRWSRCRGVYETAPVGGPEQDDYLNAVVAIDTELAPRELLAAGARPSSSGRAPGADRALGPADPRRRRPAVRRRARRDAGPRDPASPDARAGVRARAAPRRRTRARRRAGRAAGRASTGTPLALRLP